MESKKRGPFNKKVLPLSTNTSSVNIRAKRNSCSNGDLNAFEELLEDPDLERLVILQMAMQRNQIHPMIGNTGGESSFDLLQQQSQLPKRDVSPIITEGFFWREYPACEQVLYNHMHRYYEISAIQKNYKVQQFFNNVLVEEVRKAAIDTGFTVDPEFCDKKLRDRIRCFYKTHLQNAKKRLATLQKHSDSIENQTLVAVFIQCVRNPKLTFEEAYTLKTGLSASTAKISLSCDEGQIHNSSISYGAVVPDQENSRHSTSNAVLVAAAAPGAVPKKRRLDDNDKPPLPPTMMMYHHHNILSQPRHHHLPRVDGSGGNPSFHSHHHPTVYSHPDASRPCDAATLNIMSSHACYSPPMDAPPTATVPVYHHHFPPPPPQP